MRSIFIIMLVILLAACHSNSSFKSKDLITGAERPEEYLPLIKDKTVAIVANQTSMVGRTHLVDTLASLGVEIRTIFAPEHGFRDMADAGKTIEDDRDAATGIKIVSIYSGNKKPLPKDLDSIDFVIFDIQDVGTRFYTYLTSMCYVMESCAENNVPMIILDRPNPNGFYYDGPVLDTAYRSFVGLHKVPVVHGMTLGEYATMVNGEGWLKNSIRCNLTVVKCLNYDHSVLYELPVRPSPNLPNMNAIYLYPSICFSEGSVLSCGRGTPFAFQVLGAPGMPDRGFSFVPDSMFGAARPAHKGEVCYGTDLRNALADGLVPKPFINLEWIISAYNDYPDKEHFFTKYFDTLAGSAKMREQIQQGLSAQEIRNSWKAELEAFGKIRAKYLLYN